MTKTTILFFLGLLGLCLCEPIPAGSYCGSFLEGILKVNATVLSLTSANIEGSVFGIAAKCDKENVAYFAANHTVAFPTIAQTTDCLGNLLREYGISPSAVAITYDPVKNTLTITAEGTTLVLTPCTSDFFKVKAGGVPPVGAYCGVYQTVGKVKVSIVSDHVASTSGSVYGEAFACPNEAFTFSPDSSEIALPKINNKDDCLGQIMSKFSIDSSAVSIVYDAPKNELDVSGPQDSKMVLISCPPEVEGMWERFPLRGEKVYISS